VLQQLKRWVRNCARDEGVAGVIIAMIISIVAFSALAVFMSKHIGPSRDLELFQRAEAKLTITRDALLLYFNQQTSKTLPCPDTDLDGNQNSPCTGTGTVSGTLPWRTMGLARDDAVDGYGRYYKYVVVADAEEKSVCDSVTNAYDNSRVDYPGTTTDAATLEVRSTSQAAGTGEFVRFVVVSHGPNGLGGTTAAGTAMGAPVANSREEDNAASNPTEIFSGPFNGADGVDYFDDTVIFDSEHKLEASCEDSVTSGQVNASLTDNFTGGTLDSTKWVTDGGGSAPTQTGGQAQFTASTSYLATLTTSMFAPEVRPIYVSTYWTPDASNTTSGFSIVTRATPSTLVSGDLFTTGVTFRFYSTGSAGSNTITIRDSTTTHATSGNYTLTAGQQYFIEAYDDGVSAWARISQVSNPSNAAEAIDTNLSVDLTGEQRVLFVNGSGTNRIDNLIIGTPMLSALTGPADGFVSSANGTNDTATNVTIEAWVRPRTIPGSGTAATIVSQWDTTALANSGYRLYLDGSDLMLGLRSDAGGTEAVDLGISATANEWMHVAVSYDSTSNTVRAYKNGSLSSTTTTTTATGVINEGSVEFVVGADTMTSNTAASNFFYGNISDVRIWNSVRSASNVATCYKRRLGGASCATTNLVVNWKLDPSALDGGMPSGTADAYAGIGTAGTFRDGAYYAPSLAVYFRPNANEVCPASARVSAYECAFRDVTATNTNGDGVFTPPANLTAIFVKAWAGGGGGNNEGGAPADNYGGGGAFGRGLVPNKGSWDITLGTGGAAAASGDGGDGTDTTIDVGGDSMFGVEAGTGAGDNNNNDDGTGGNNVAFDSEVVNDTDADGFEPAAGCIPAGDPCTDPNAGPSYLAAALRTPGRGGDGTSNTPFVGAAGAVILLW